MSTTSLLAVGADELAVVMFGRLDAWLRGRYAADRVVCEGWFRGDQGRVRVGFLGDQGAREGWFPWGPGSAWGLGSLGTKEGASFGIPGDQGAHEDRVSRGPGSA
ncbi:hypothetical protein GCM10007387_59160 [Pseudoduganella albidiflava]|uniref:Uncharacterized protein n=1 Tax=Pseudoduganella albidiflava TaxID=321983 RepID=A0AA88C443_9BURK|nr:hypothetical protein GCM10007387_59160 [Pseudoduganella albidiflava]